MTRRLTVWNVLILIAYLFFITVLVSLYQYLNVQDNKCLMTFMYETPNFISIPLPRKLEKTFPNYRIYAYKEGKKDNKFSHSDFNGFPVIFIPGSSGSHKQVRSFASVSMNFFWHRPIRTHLDFFAIDYNEELSGVYGPYLQNQTLFLKEAIKVIRRIYYKRNENDNKLIVIAHSFGGIIFKGLITLSSFKFDDVFLFLTLATPHYRSVFPFDTSFYDYYTNINDRLKDPITYESYQNMAKISIAGGLNDNLVRSDLTNTEEVNQWSLTSNALPEVWLYADHKCIVWCRQLIKKLVHLIFDLLEERHHDPKLTNRNEIIAHHLNNRFNDRLTPRYRIRSIFEIGKHKGMKRFETGKRLFVFDKLKVIENTIYQFKFVPNTFISILSTNLYKSDWIYACDENSECKNVQNYTNIPVPSTNEFDGIKRNHFIIDSDSYLDQNYNTLALKISPSTIRTAFQFERIIKGRRDKVIKMPTIFNRLLNLFRPFNTVLEVSIGEESTFYNLTLDKFDQIWHNYNLKMEIGRCYSQAKEESVIRMHVPWYREDHFYAIEFKKESTFHAVLNLNVPKYRHKDTRKATLQLLLDPYCEYRLKIKFSIRETFIQIFRHYAFLFLPVATSIILMAYSVQIKPNSNDDLNQLVKRHEHYSTLKFTLLYYMDEITCFGIMPALPHLIHFCMDKIFGEFGLPDYLESKSLHIKHTRHDSHIDSLFASYLVYSFIYFILFMIAHLLSFFFLFFINLNSFIIFGSNSLQCLNQSLVHILSTKKFHSKLTFLNLTTYRKFILMLIFLLLIYLKLIFYISLLIYLYNIALFTTESSFSQQKIGLKKSTTRIYLEISKFILISIAFTPLIPKFIVWFTTEQFVFDSTTILFKVCFAISFIQLHFRLNQRDLPRKMNIVLSYAIKFFAILCLCLAHLDYTLITTSLIIVLILRSTFEFATPD